MNIRFDYHFLLLTKNTISIIYKLFAKQLTEVVILTDFGIHTNPLRFYF